MKTNSIFSYPVFKSHYVNVDIGASSLNGSLKIQAFNDKNESIVKDRLSVFDDDETRNEDSFERNVAKKIAKFETKYRDEISKHDKDGETYVTICYPGPGKKIAERKSGFLLSNFFYDNNRRERYKRPINPENIDTELRKTGIKVVQTRHANDMAGAGACLLNKLKDKYPEVLVPGQEILYMYPGGGLGTGMIIVDNDNIKVKPTESQHVIKNRHFSESVEEDAKAANLRKNFAEELNLTLEQTAQIGENTKVVTDYKEFSKLFPYISKTEFNNASKEVISKYMDSLAHIIAMKICDSKINTVVLTGPIAKAIRHAVYNNPHFKDRTSESETENFKAILKKKVRDNLSTVGRLLMGNPDNLNIIFLDIADNTDGAQLLQKGVPVGNPANWYNIYQ